MSTTATHTTAVELQPPQSGVLESRQERSYAAVPDTDDTLLQASLVDDSQVPEGGYGWAIVFGCAVICWWFVGTSYCWGIMQAALVERGLSSPSTLSFVGSLTTGCISFLAIINARVIRRMGIRLAALTGIGLIGIGEILSSFAINSIPGLFITQGVVGGVGTSLCFMVVSVTPSQYFNVKRGLAYGIIYAGGGFGGATNSFIMDALIHRLGPVWTFRVMGLITLGTGLPAAWLVKERIPSRRTAFIEWRLFRDVRFSLLYLVGAIGTFPLFVPPFFLPLYTNSLGFASSTGAGVVAGFNFSSAVGRLICGFFCDRIGPLNTLCGSLLLSAVSILVLWPVSLSIGPLVAFVIINGMANGGFFSTMPTVIGNVFGSARVSVAMGMTVTGWVGGYLMFIYDISCSVLGMKPDWSALHVLAAAGWLSDTAAATAIKAPSPDLIMRALPNAPNGYSPQGVSCPSNRPAVRSAATVSPSEADWLKERRKKTTAALTNFFSRVPITNFDAAGYIKNFAINASALPNIGIAVSGGGYRALMNGAGVLQAFDSRTKGSADNGHLGGLLQSATYLSGLSGGGWLVGSLYMNNDTTVTALGTGQKGSTWDFTRSILQGPAKRGSSILNTIDYYRQIMDTVDTKRNASFEVSITDYWGRALSYQLIDASKGGPAYTWSSIALSSDFRDASVPMPILVADGRNPGEKLIGGNATVFEFNPWEFGTFDPTVFGFVPLEFLGSKFKAGALPSNESCIRGFDNAGFVMGTSSSLFNQFALQLDGVDIPESIKKELRKILETIGNENNDIAEYKPNPFYHYSNRSSPFANVDSLPVVDGGEDLQNIPLHPLVQPERHVDVIFAIDSSADNKFNWPNGTALVATYQRSLNKTGIANGTAFPSIPDQNTFINLGLNTKPTFFGCNSSNITGTSPLVVYIPNYPYSTYSNVSTFTMSYENNVRDDIIKNGYNVATMGNGTREKEWPICVGCAILSRSFERTRTTVPDVCQQCFKNHCWDGRVNSTSPNTYEPTVINKSVSPKRNAAISMHASSGMPGVIALVITALFTAIFC
ncbi:Lysophospholipase 1 [Ophidiomyces ophidiicola]|nr:Lysophospholipase 1 [Ophidiomyces ophidiicola]KAI2040394.1 Lysophospholipase 1 [Ophidiomyces ophidiicola]KAI2044578.1 Lysophospholipase 1 [Ophidiomyces ophidiicola]KAI2148004.1 Lysophospholipase 1 [Ophidiomyces ophidiicola]KAI2232501.1 Lysophospholipase 1 [Ophidiomyces ophidiicola]